MAEQNLLCQAPGLKQAPGDWSAGLPGSHEMTEAARVREKRGTRVDPYVRAHPFRALNRRRHMKGIGALTYGPLSTLAPIDAPMPVPGSGEVRVRVVASALNPADYKVILGTLKFLHARNRPLIVGYDFSGTIDAVGPSVTEVGRERVRRRRAAFPRGLGVERHRAIRRRVPRNHRG